MFGAPYVLNVIVGLAISSILFLAWELGSPRLSRARPDWRDDKALRFIVFGDSWVDNGLNGLEASRLRLKPEHPQRENWIGYMCREVSGTAMRIHDCLN